MMRNTLYEQNSVRHGPFSLNIIFLVSSAYHPNLTVRIKIV